MGTQTTSLSLHIPQFPTSTPQNHGFLSSPSSSLSTSHHHLTLPFLPTQWNTLKSPPLTTLRLLALKSGRKPRGGVSEDEKEEEEEEGIFLPFGKMREWLERKPPGFGEGKVYDTSIEDKLLDEMSLSRRNPQVGSLKEGNLNKGRSDDSGPNKAQPKEENVVAVGVRVQVGNLPKKKNIHRDLKAAFGEFPGLVSIVPAVSGNKKTKDPICKGIAFVDLKSEEDAVRFVQQFSGHIVAFGKIQKQIKCQLMKLQSSSSSDDDNSQLRVPNLKVELDSEQLYVRDSAVEDNAFDALDDQEDEFEDSAFDVLNDQEDVFEDSAFDAFDEESNEFDDKCEDAEFEDDIEDVEPLVTSGMNNEGRVTMEPKPEAAGSSRFLNKQQQKKKVVKKNKVIAKGKQDKSPNLVIPGSAKRLKVKEKAVLAGVLSKYASNAASATK